MNLVRSLFTIIVVFYALALLLYLILRVSFGDGFWWLPSRGRSWVPLTCRCWQRWNCGQ